MSYGVVRAGPSRCSHTGRSMSTLEAFPARWFPARVLVTRRACAVFLLMLVGITAAARADELDYGLEERKVAAIRLVGNTAFEDGELKALLPFQEAKWFAPFRRAADRSRSPHPVASPSPAV